jgi:hypothetical protein
LRIIAALSIPPDDTVAVPPLDIVALTSFPLDSINRDLTSRRAPITVTRTAAGTKTPL